MITKKLNITESIHLTSPGIRLKKIMLIIYTIYKNRLIIFG